MAAAGSRTLKLTLLTDTDKFSRGLSDAESRTKRFGGKLRDFGAIAATAFAAAGAAALAVGAHVLEAGAKFEDMDKKASTVFGNQLGTVQAWADANAGAMGLTSRELTGLSANFADLLIPMGFTREQAAEMAMETNELSGALSKWSGGTRTAAEVSEILAKAMLGERESLKELGVSITEADVQTRILEKGQQDLTGAAREQAEALATQELIMERTVDAQKGWAEGQDDLSVKINTLKAKVKEFKEQAIEKLLPFVIAAAEKFQEWAGVLSEQLAPHLEALKAWWAENGPAIMETAQALWETLTEAFTAIGSAIETVIGWFQRGDEEAVGSFSSIKAFADEVWPQIQAIVTDAVEAIRDIIERVTAIVEGIWERYGEQLTKFAEGTWENIQKVIKGALDIIEGIFEVFSGVFSGDWEKAWDGVKKIFSGVWEAIEGILGQALNALATVMSIALDALKELWGAAWTKIKEFVAGIWEGIKEKVRDGKDYVTGKFDELVSFVTRLPGRITNAASGMWDGIKSAFRSAVNWIISKWNNLRLTVGGGTFDLPGPLGSVTIPSITLDTPNIPYLDTGGTILETGLAVVHKGETVVPANTRSGPPVVNINVTGTMLDPEGVARAVERVIRDSHRRHGGLATA